MSKSEYKSNNHNKYLCNYHIILVCKYRKKLLQKKLNDDIQQLVFDYCNKHNVKIKAMQSDIDHLHILIDCDTYIQPHKFISYMKQYTTYHIWQLQKQLLTKNFWKEKTFWTDGYFCCTIGNATLDRIQEYINNQG
jgi:putative transposase